MKTTERSEPLELSGEKDTRGVPKEIIDMRNADRAAMEADKQYRHRALNNLSKQGNFTGNQADIEREIARLKSEDVQTN